MNLKKNKEKMRTREEIEASPYVWGTPSEQRKIIVELLLDIREILMNDSEYIKRLNLAKVKITSAEEVEKEMEEEMMGIAGIIEGVVPEKKAKKILSEKI